MKFISRITFCSKIAFCFIKFIKTLLYFNWKKLIYTILTLFLNWKKLIYSVLTLFCNVKKAILVPLNPIFVKKNKKMAFLFFAKILVTINVFNILRPISTTQDNNFVKNFTKIFKKYFKNFFRYAKLYRQTNCRCRKKETGLICNLQTIKWKF